MQDNEQTAIPQQVVDFLRGLYGAIINHDKALMQRLYEHGFKEYTNIYYAHSRWPAAEGVEAALGIHDELFMSLYREYYFRHVYTRLFADKDDSKQSYQNYSFLFSYLCEVEEIFTLELPQIWIYEILDAFTTQYLYHCRHFASSDLALSSRKKTDEATEANAESDAEAWNRNAVFDILHAIQEISQANQLLTAYKKNIPITLENNFTQYSTTALFQQLGLFALVQLARLHCSEAQYSSVLACLNHIDSAIFYSRRMPSYCAATAFYYIGFSYLMSSRIRDAYKFFLFAYTNIEKNASMPIGSEVVAKNIELISSKVILLISLCHVLIPYMKLDDKLNASIREQHGDKIIKLQQAHKSGEVGDHTKVLSQLFDQASVTFVSAHITQEQAQKLISLFNNLVLYRKIYTYMQLYTTMPLNKLAAYLEVSSEVLAQYLEDFQKNNTQTVWKQGPLLEGQQAATFEINFFIENDMIHITDRREKKSSTQFFKNSIEKLNLALIKLNKHQM